MNPPKEIDSPAPLEDEMIKFRFPDSDNMKELRNLLYEFNKIKYENSNRLEQKIRGENEST